MSGKKCFSKHLFDFCTPVSSYEKHIALYQGVVFNSLIIQSKIKTKQINIWFVSEIYKPGKLELNHFLNIRSNDEAVYQLHCSVLGWK